MNIVFFVKKRALSFLLAATLALSPITVLTPQPAHAEAQVILFPDRT